MVHFGICRILPARVRLWIPSRRMALWIGRVYLGNRRSAAMVAGKKLKVAYADLYLREMERWIAMGFYFLQSGGAS